MNHASRFRCVLLCIAVAAPLPALAVPITYAITGVGTGTVGTTAFTNAPYLICIATDTTQVTNEGGTILAATATTTITITNLGSGQVTDGTGFVVAQPSSQAAFIRVPGFADLLTMNDPAFQTYPGTTALGPLANLAPANLGQFTNLQTALGPMTLASSGNVTFQATLGPCPSLPGPSAATAIPVPASGPATLGLAALMVSLAGAAMLRRRTAGRRRPG